MYRKILFSLAGFLHSVAVLAQSPDLYPPTVPETVDVTLFNIILYVVLPILLVGAFFWYQRSQKKKQKRKLQEREKETRNKRSKN